MQLWIIIDKIMISIHMCNNLPLHTFLEVHMEASTRRVIDLRQSPAQRIMQLLTSDLKNAHEKRAVGNRCNRKPQTDGISSRCKKHLSMSIWHSYLSIHVTHYGGYAILFNRIRWPYRSPCSLKRWQKWTRWKDGMKKMGGVEICGVPVDLPLSRTVRSLWTHARRTEAVSRDHQGMC